MDGRRDGRGRPGSRGRRPGGATGRIEGRPEGSWKLRCGFRRLQELKTKHANEVLMTLSSPGTRFKEALADDSHDSNMTALILRCIAKALECESQRQGTISLLTTIEGSNFLKLKLMEFMLGLTGDEFEMMDRKESISDVIKLFIALAQNLPHSLSTLLGIFSIIEIVVTKLRLLDLLDDTLEHAFETCKECKEGIMKPKPMKQSRERQMEREDEREPDNDFRDINVCPQTVDVAAGMNHNPFLRRNKEKGGYRDLDHYLDVQFRLLREDFICPLREGIQEYIEALHNTGQVKRLQDLRIYKDVQIISPICDKSGLSYRICFDVDKLKRVRWESSKRLIFGSLVCLSRDGFRTMLFASVSNREIKLISKGIVDLKFENTHDEMAALPRDARFVMAETTAYFEAYKHVLRGLQNMRRIPFERYIVRCETNEVKPPRYLRDRTITYDLRPLVDDIILQGEKKLRNLGIPVLRDPNYNFSPLSGKCANVRIRDFDRWPSAAQLYLDDSQYKAVQRALTNEFVITQGPPGTGKTYIGLKIVKALLHNYKVWNTNQEGVVNHRPMLIVCYTNHALDQFLEGILSFYSGDILRVGGRSSSEVLKNHNINTYRMKMRKSREIDGNITREARRMGWELNQIREAINEIALKIEIAEREIIHEDYLQPFMGHYYNDLVQGFEQYVRFHNPGISLKRIKKSSAIVEWLGYGTILQIQHGDLEVPQEQLRQDVDEDGDLIDELPDEEDEQVDVVDDVDRMVEMRQIDDEDDIDLDFLEEFGLPADLERKFAKIQIKAKAVALNVSEFENVDDGDGGWQIDRKQKKKMKNKLRKELRSTNRMTEREFLNLQRMEHDIWGLTEKDKWRLYRYWTHKFCCSYRDQIRGKEAEYERSATRLREIQMQEDQQIMRLATVIGMTTTGAARYQSVLQDIGPRVVVVEEAAEVLEAHVLTTLSPDCEHLILIGDHKQLKPNPTVYKLAKDYNLDVSLFERMVKNGMECDCLKYQHRMRPTISKMMKIIYPELEDHEIVTTYPDIKGISNNMFFIHHDYPESNDEEQKSHSNLYEAEYIVALCRYLKLQGYKPDQITILTLYSGQLFQLKKLMPKSEFYGTRITVVDNFQGEENDIILLSLVRSNDDGKIGFLKIENRVCVALSRAKHGFYVIGNLNLMSGNSDLWRKVVEHAKQENLYGEGLRLYCQNHPNDAGIHATEPEDFKKAPEGGCMKPCEYRLSCGHTCSLVCHVIDADHIESKCRKPCQKRTCENEEHRCRRMCYQSCGECSIPVAKRLPSCGHMQNVPCSTKPHLFKCMAECEERLPCGHMCQSLCGERHTEYCQHQVTKKFKCGHVVKVHCFEEDSAICTKPCKQNLSCLHQCKGTCGECLNGRLHVGCKKRCERPLICGHICPDSCSKCPPCQKPCNNRCVHSRCTQTCGELCIQCVEKCAWTCNHYTCTKRCFEPCDRPRCNMPCRLQLKCTHPCIGLCGEPCPKKCRICHREEVTEIFFGTEDEDDARFVELEDCGHIFEVTQLDHYIDNFGKGDKGDASIKLIECPRCKTLIRRNLRYGNEVKKTVLDIENVKNKIIGDRKKIQRMRYDIPEEIRILSRKYPSDGKAMRKVYDTLFEMNVDESTLAAVTNQIKFLEAINKIEQDWEKNIRNEELRNMFKNECLNDLNLFRYWILSTRKYFTEQELTDAQDEIARLQSFRRFIMCIDRMVTRRDAVPSKLKSSLGEVEILLKAGEKLNTGERDFMESVLKDLERAFPASGLGVSEEEKIQIVRALGERKGHWFKCPNGHPYVIGDCGGATVESRCPECNATIGGGSHQLRSDNQFAGEMDGAQFPAWSEQANLLNYQGI